MGLGLVGTDSRGNGWILASTINEAEAKVVSIAVKS